MKTLIKTYLLNPVKYFIASKTQDILIKWVNKLTKHKRPVIKTCAVNQSAWYKLLVVISYEKNNQDLLNCAHGMKLDQLIRYVNPLSQKYRIPLETINSYKWA